MVAVLENLAKTRAVQYVTDVVTAVRDELEPPLIYHEFPNSVIHPQEFRTEILFWRNGPNVGGGAAFLDMLRETSPEVYLSELGRSREDILNFLGRQHDNQSGGFRQFSGSKESKASPPTVFATDSAVRIMRHLSHVDDNHPLGYANAAGLIGREVVDKIIDFAVKSQDKTGGFHYNPDINTRGEGRPSLWNTRHAINILWNLGQNIDIESIKGFLSSCLAMSSDRTIGFKESTSSYSSTAPTSEATYSALKILEILGEKTWISDSREGILAFLRSCWSADKRGLGGFAHQEGGKPTLLNTNEVLSSLAILGAEIDDVVPEGERMKLTQFYKRHCQSRLPRILVFGFAPGWRPNVYVMRVTMDTLKQVSEKNPDFTQLYNEIYGDSVRTVDGIYFFSPALFLRRKLGSDDQKDTS